MSSTGEPPSLHNPAAAEDTDAAAPDGALLRLHAALKNLDAAIFDALRTLDVALGRPPASPPAEALPYRELGRLKLHLEAAAGHPPVPRERNLSAMALDWAEDEEEDEADATAVATS
jgi:hypothetical protein